MSQNNSKIDLSQIFLGGNKCVTATYTNGTGSTEALTPGIVFGRITASAKVAKQDKDSTDGSQLGRFVLMSSHAAIANGADATLTLCYTGEVDASKLVWGTGESLTTAVGTVGINQDILVANSQLVLVTGIENTKYDNE